MHHSTLLYKFRTDLITGWENIPAVTSPSAEMSRDALQPWQNTSKQEQNDGYAWSLKDCLIEWLRFGYEHPYQYAHAEENTVSYE